MRAGESQRAGLILDAGGGIQDAKNLHRRLDRALHHDVHAAKRFDWIVKEEDAGDQCHEFRCRKVREVNIKKGKADPNRSNRLYERRNRFCRASDAHHVVKLNPIAAPKRFFLVLFAGK